MTWIVTDARVGTQAIDVTATTTATDVPAGSQPPIGTIIRAVDETYGPGEFIFLNGVASTVAGDVVIYDPYAGTTTRAVSASRGPVAVAMSANVANQRGWYQISGSALVKVSAGVTANALLCLSATAGTISHTAVTAQRVDNAIAKTATDTPVTGKAIVLINRPAANGYGA